MSARAIGLAHVSREIEWREAIDCGGLWRSASILTYKSFEPIGPACLPV